MKAERCIASWFIVGKRTGRPVSFSVFLILVVSLTVLLPLSGITSGGTLDSGLKGVRAEADLRSDAASDSVLHVLPPLGAGAGGSDDLDSTLVNFLKVTICEPDGGGICTAVREFTSQKTWRGGLDYITFQGHHYHVNWNVAKSEVGKGFEVHFTVAGLEIGHTAYSPATGRTVPIKFRVANHPRIRARVMREQGFSAAEIAAALRNEFGLSEDEIGEILLAEDFSCVEIGEAVILVFNLDAWQGAAWMKGFGCSARETYDVLMLIFDIQDEIDIERILFAAGYEMKEFIDFTAFGTVEKFTPVLYFDGAHKGLPMSAQLYFETVMALAIAPGDHIKWETPFDGPCDSSGVVWLEGRDDGSCGMQNNDFQKLIDGDVPTYYKVISDIETVDEGRVRIAYWWFYGFQEECNPICLVYCGRDGSHHGDWECIQVTTSPDRSTADYVTYVFHGQWYTRQHGGYSSYEGRPIGYVGKLAHGCYHNDDHSGWMTGTPSHCCEYADFRDETPSTIWYEADENLVSLRGNSEPWMLADRVKSTYEHKGKRYTILEWQWGPPIQYCKWWVFTCVDWETTLGCATHPTTEGTPPGLNWGLISCSGEGCGGYNAGCPYTGTPDYNDGWPWDSSPPGLLSDGQPAADIMATAEPGEYDGLSLGLSTANPCVDAPLVGTFSVPVAMDVDLKVYDVRGRLINSIINKRAKPGVHQFEWNLERASGLQVAPGIYFLRLETPDRWITRKVVIQR